METPFNNILLLMASGVLLLMFDIVIPSHGLLSLAGVGCMVAGIVAAFGVSQVAGTIALALTVILVPTIFLITIKVWHRTPIGRAISPPTPPLTDADRVRPATDLAALVGRTGKAVSLLRPVGACEFDHMRLECRAEFGIIQPGTPGVGVRVAGLGRIVAPRQATSDARAS